MFLNDAMKGKTHNLITIVCIFCLFEVGVHAS